MQSAKCEGRSENGAASEQVDKSSGAVRAMFGDIAHGYDRLNHLLSANQDKRWRRRAIKVLSPRAGERILDVCCGTGDLTFECVHQQPRCHVVGADFAVPMLQLAHSKLESHNSQLTTQFLAGDGLRLPFADATFDAAMVAFGVRNFQNTEAGLREMGRVVRRGGKVLILEFMRPTSPLLRGGALAFNFVLAPIGRKVSGHPTAYNYLPQSIGGFYSRREFTQLLQRVGLTNVRSFDYLAGVATTFIAHKPS